MDDQLHTVVHPECLSLCSSGINLIPIHSTVRLSTNLSIPCLFWRHYV